MFLMLAVSTNVGIAGCVAVDSKWIGLGFNVSKLLDDRMAVIERERERERQRLNDVD